MQHFIFTAFLNRLQLGTPQRHANICVFPVLSDVPPQLHYLSLREALAAEKITISEINEAGSVPNLKAVNSGEIPVLILDGEELKGAKQNRIANTSMLLSGHSETVIPVSCTERGRWAYDSSTFSNGGTMLTCKARYRKSERVKANLERNNRHDANQREIWADIEKNHRQHQTISASRALHDVYLQKEWAISQYLKSFERFSNQVGILVFINGELAGLDVLSSPTAYRHCHFKLLKSHILEALAGKKFTGDIVDMKIDAHFFMESLFDVFLDKHKAIGIGTEYRFNNGATGGAILSTHEEVIHLTAYSKGLIGSSEPPPALDHLSEDEPVAPIVPIRPKLRYQKQRSMALEEFV